MKEKGWKTLAIIFISLFVLETIGIIFLINLGNSTIDKKNECIAECMNFGEDATYSFNMYDNICECYIGNELAKTKYIR